MGVQRTTIGVTGIALMAAVLGGCDYVKDVPMLGRYVAKNVCHDVLVSGYAPRRPPSVMYRTLRRH